MKLSGFFLSNLVSCLNQYIKRVFSTDIKQRTSIDEHSVEINVVHIF